MRAVRIYTEQHLARDVELELDDDTRHYAYAVRRLNKNSKLTLFNGDGFDYPSKILNCSKKQLLIKITDCTKINTESNLNTHLYLGVSKSSHMDYAIQKTVEAGVNTIQPVLMERSLSKANDKSLRNKHHHWKRIIQSACEQSGRAVVPELNLTCEFETIKEINNNECGLVFDANATQTIEKLSHKQPHSIKLVVGPEGGITENELNQVTNKGFQTIRCGPRILRTETAALTAVLAMQVLFGDLRN